LRERINQYGHGLRITSFQPSQAFIIGLEMGWSTKKKKKNRSHICLMVHRRIMNYGSSAILLTLYVVLIVHV
jgi:hypothetical protein